MSHPSDDSPRPEPRPADAARPAPETPAAPAPARPAAEKPTGQKPRTATEPAPADIPVVEDTGRGGRTAGIWIALVLGAIVLILLLIFIIQNNVSASFHYFGSQFDLPLGVAMLLAAIAGALVMALVGSVRMIQMAWTMRKMRKDLQAIRQRVGR